MAAWACLCYTGILPWDYLYLHFWTTAAVACAVGVVATLVLVLPHPPRSSSAATDLFLGRVLNPRPFVLGRVLDIKMYLYLIGAVHLELNILSCAAAHYASSSSPASSADKGAGPGLAAALLSFFVTEYLYFENVHLYTYDLFAERVGFKLVWGCLCFYPFFYAVPVLAAATPSIGSSSSLPYHALAAAVFFAGWGLSRGANLQKFWFKQRGPAGAEAGKEQEVVRSADGKHSLFCGGLWGHARHVNYLGEILEAVGIAMAAGGWAPWAYPLYYVLLLVPRERDDDARCQAKYGELWGVYCARVPWRIVPGVY